MTKLCHSHEENATLLYSPKNSEKNPHLGSRYPGKGKQTVKQIESSTTHLWSRPVAAIAVVSRTYEWYPQTEPFLTGWK